MAIFIGIDPGVKTGIATWVRTPDGAGFQRVKTTNIVQALEYCYELWQKNGKDVRIVFEDARRRTWLPREKSLSEYRGKLMGAGSVKRDCDIWEEFCKEYAIPYTAIPPRKGATKWSADYFAKVTGWKGRTSNHARDAALLVFGK